MELQVYSIRDDKSQYYNRPFYCHTHGEAERNLKTALQDQNSMVSKYPEDFSLWHLGKFDDSVGKIMALEAPTHIANAVDLKPANN